MNILIQNTNYTYIYINIHRVSKCEHIYRYSIVLLADLKS